MNFRVLKVNGNGALEGEWLNPDPVTGGDIFDIICADDVAEDITEVKAGDVKELTLV
jgi:hypothetical protein